MKVLLVLANTSMDNLIPLSVSLLSACLKKVGHEVRLFDTTFYKTREKTGDTARIETLQVKQANLKTSGISFKKSNLVLDFKKLVDEFKPDLVGVSVVEPTYLIGLQLLDSIKDLGVPTIMGGIHCTFSPEDVIKEASVDMVCVGEGERPLVELVNRMANNKEYNNIPNIWVKDNGRIYRNSIGDLAELDNLPDQDWQIYEKERFYKPMGGKISITGTFELNRGCPYYCDFCCNKELQSIYKEHGRYYRQRDVDIFMDEIRAKRRQYGIEYIYIVAENFLGMTEDRFNKFIKHYKEIRLPFWIQSRPETIIKDRLLQLRDVGCEGLSMGVEHGNEKFRREVLNRIVSNEIIIKAFEIAKETGIRISANNIIGFPTETRDLVFDTIELNRIINVDNVIVNIFAPYRGTRLRQLCVEKGYLSSDAIVGDYRQDVDVVMPQFTPEQIKGMHRTFTLYVKLPKSRWPEIERAEKSDETFKRLRVEYEN